MCFLFVLWDRYSSCFFTVPLSDPQSEFPDVGLRTFTAVGDLLWYYCSPVSGSPTCQLLDLILLWLQPQLPFHCTILFVFGDEVSFFGRFQHHPVNDCSTASFDFGALAGNEHTSFYSSILNWKSIDIEGISLWIEWLVHAQ